MEILVVLAVVAVIWIVTSLSSRPVHRPINVEPTELMQLKAQCAERAASEAKLIAELIPLRAEIQALRVENGDLKRQITRAAWTAEAPPLAAKEPFDRTSGNEHKLNNWD